MNMDKNKRFGENEAVEKQIEILEKILRKNKVLIQVLEKLEKSNLKKYYVAAGCINQTVFNYYHDYPLDYGIEDLDIVYYDDTDLSYEKEDSVIQYLSSLCKDIPLSLDIKNEARVHLWYPEKYGTVIKPYTSVEDAIRCWGTSITCIGVRLEKGHFVVCAPYGLNDLFTMTIRPIKKQFSKEQYQIKTAKWKTKWPLLTILPWNSK